MKEVRIGIIGAGRIAEVMAAAYSLIAEVRLVAVADIVVSAADRMAQRFSIKQVFQDYGDLLAQAEANAVLICAPTFLHKEMALASVQAGKHVFCQKPLALTVADCECVSQAAEEAGVILQTGFMLRFTPPFREVKEILVHCYIDY